MGEPPVAARPMLLETGDVRSLQALRTRGDFEFDCLAFVQRLIAIPLNSGEVDENVFARLSLDETKAFTGIKPLYCSLFFQLCISFLFELFGVFSTALSTKKWPASVDLQASDKSKGFTRATNASPV
jgi:hypothetical protein